MLLETVTVFGDSGFILPASGVLVAVLLASGDRRTALAFAAAVTTCAALTVAAKISFMIFGVSAIHSPSGHASMATIFFSCFGAIALRSKGSGPGRVGAAICGALVLLIAVSRVTLRAHTWSEALIGVAIGLFVFALFWRFSASRLAIGRRTLGLYFAAALGLYAVFGGSVTVEEPLERLAAHLGHVLRR